jgi:serine/threonine protein kinase
MFGTPKEGFLAKATDFSFSYAGTEETEIMSVPCTPPWEAPEYSRVPIQLRDAKRADVFSLGLVCFWVFFRSDLLEYWAGHAKAYNNHYRDLQRDDEKSLSKLKVENNLQGFADRHLGRHDSARRDHVKRFQQFLVHSLTRNKKERASNLWEMFNLVSNSDDVERPKDMDTWMRNITRDPSVDGDGGTIGAFQVTTIFNISL